MDKPCVTGEVQFRSLCFGLQKDETGAFIQPPALPEGGYFQLSAIPEPSCFLTLQEQDTTPPEETVQCPIHLGLGHFQG